MFGKPQGSFIETLKSITSSWKDSYKQSSLIEYTAKTDKAPPPADMFANLPSQTNFQIVILKYVLFDKEIVVVSVQETSTEIIADVDIKTLGVGREASIEEIQEAYNRLREFFDPSKNSDPNIKIFFDDLTLAYKTLVNKQSRAEYDEYIDQHIKLSHLWKEQQGIKDEEENEETIRRKKERGKRRFEEGFQSVNDEFYENWQSRTRRARAAANGGEGHQSRSNFDFNFGGKDQENQQNTQEAQATVNFNGRNIVVTVPITIHEALAGCKKIVKFNRQVKCDSCKGTKEQDGKVGATCYSCGGEGIKKDPLFHKETMCNTCQGHGTLVRHPCSNCNGKGLVTKHVEKTFEVPQYTDHDETLQFEHEGNESTYYQKGEDGHLQIIVHVQKDPNLRRDGLNVISSHYITLTDAILGCNIAVPTVKGIQNIKYQHSGISTMKEIFYGKGITTPSKQEGDHIAEINIVIPKNLNEEAINLIKEFQKDEFKQNKFDPTVEMYQDKDDAGYFRQASNNANSNNTSKGSFFSREAEDKVDTLEQQVKSNSSEVKENEELKQELPSEIEQKQQANRPPKTRVALITGYNGLNFCGSQKNPGVRTVEEEIEKALYRMGYIAEFNFGDLKKIGWNRATRTDKRVHALQNVFSCKIHMDKREDDEEVRKRLNKELPEDIRIFCMLQCSNRFNAKNCTSNREYSYYLPTFLLTKITDVYLGSNSKKESQQDIQQEPSPDKNGESQHQNNEEAKQEKENVEEQKKPSGIKIIKQNNDNEDSNDFNAKAVDDYKQQENYLTRNIDHIPTSHYETLYRKRLTEEEKLRVENLFKQFLGTHKYHNFTKEVKASQTAASRFMLELTANDYMYVNKDTMQVTSVEDPDAIEFVHFFLKGQSFLYNQIRKMIGSIIQIMRGGLEDSFLEHTMTDNFVNVALAPGDGLLLEQVCYDKYNSINDNKKSEIMLKRVGQSIEVKDFREQIVAHIAKREIQDKAFVRWMCLFDDYCEDFYVKKPTINQ